MGWQKSANRRQTTGDGLVNYTELQAIKPSLTRQHLVYLFEIGCLTDTNRIGHVRSTFLYNLFAGADFVKFVLVDECEFWSQALTLGMYSLSLNEVVDYRSLSGIAPVSSGLLLQIVVNSIIEVELISISCVVGGGKMKHTSIRSQLPCNDSNLLCTPLKQKSTSPPQ